ncbi:DBH-like monooxygenase protein 2 homolog [Styela clava]
MATGYKILIIFPLLFTVVWGGNGTSSKEITYDGSKDLSAGINVMWKVEEKSIVLKLKYRATGWVGIGFSKSKHPQSMADSDIIIGWVTMDNAFVLDAYSKENGVPDVDEKSEVDLISGKEESGYTTIVFRRPIVAMNDDDVTIEVGQKK